MAQCTCVTINQCSLEGKGSTIERLFIAYLNCNCGYMLYIALHARKVRSIKVAQHAQYILKITTGFCIYRSSDFRICSGRLGSGIWGLGSIWDLIHLIPSHPGPVSRVPCPVSRVPCPVPVGVSFELRFM